MDKKRKLLENGTKSAATEPSALKISKEDVKKMLEPLNMEQVIDILKDAATWHVDVLDEVRKVVDKDPANRKVFVRGLGWDTTSDTLKAFFSLCGEVEEGAVILDKSTGKSRGFGFVTFRHMDGALQALKEPSKRIDGRMTVCQLASTGSQAANSNQDVAQRKIYVGNVPMELVADKLLALFAQYGEIEEGPLGFDKFTGRSRGFALIIYKSVESARRALQEPIKTVDGHQMHCKLAVEGQKQKQAGTQGRTESDGSRLGSQVATQSAVPTGAGLQYGSMNPGLITTGIPLNQGMNQALTPSLNSGLHSGLASHNQGLTSLNASLNQSYSLNHSLNPSLGHSLNPSLNGSFNSPLTQGVGQVETSLGMTTYGTHLGVSPYGTQPTGLTGQPTGYATMGGIPLYAPATNSVASQQAAALQAAGGHYAYATYQNPQLGSSSASRAPTVGSLASLPSYYNL